MAETLPGLLVAQHQRVRWHLLNVGNNGEYHAVHFHGLPFTVHAKKEHRMGVYNLFPGSPNTDICILLGTPQKNTVLTFLIKNKYVCGYLTFLNAGVFGTVEMRPPTVGTWLVECTVGEFQLAGMRAKLLVYNPGRCTQRVFQIFKTITFNAKEKKYTVRMV